jgi:hypothetical protein
MMIASIATGSENIANRRAQIASREVGSSTIRRRIMMASSSEFDVSQISQRGVLPRHIKERLRHRNRRRNGWVCFHAIGQDFHGRLRGNRFSRELPQVRASYHRSWTINGTL